MGGVTEAGFSNSNTLVVSHERKMIEVAQGNHRRRPHEIRPRLDDPPGPLEVADIVVSDAALAPDDQDMLKSHGVEALLA
jgi:hypothetical protein